MDALDALPKFKPIMPLDTFAVDRIKPPREHHGFIVVLCSEFGY